MSSVGKPCGTAAVGLFDGMKKALPHGADTVGSASMTEGKTRSVSDQLIHIPFGEDLDQVIGFVSLDLCNIEGVGEHRAEQCAVASFQKQIIHSGAVGVADDINIGQL